MDKTTQRQDRSFFLSYSCSINTSACLTQVKCIKSAVCLLHFISFQLCGLCCLSPFNCVASSAFLLYQLISSFFTSVVFLQTTFSYPSYGSTA